MNHVAFPRIAALFFPLAAMIATGCVVEQGSDIDMAAEMTDEAADALVTARNEEQISQGMDHACLVDSTGALHCWGRNDVGQVGDGTTLGDMTCVSGSYSYPCRVNPTAIASMGTNVTAVSAGASHTCAIKDGVVYCWGKNSSGVVGTAGATCNKSISTPSAVPLPAPAVDVAVASSHSCALTSSGEVYCWGDHGQIGSGPSSALPAGRSKCSAYDSATPLKLAFADVPEAGKAVLRLAGAPGSASTCAVHVDGGVSCWGAWDEGANPDNNNIGGYLPQAVVRGHGTGSPVRLTGVSAASVSDSRACALFAEDGHVECWGRSGSPNNGCGQGGASKYDCQPEPKPVKEATPSGNVLLVGAEELSAGDSTTCVMMADDTPRCWGDNTNCTVGSGAAYFTAATPMTNSNGSAITTAWSIVVGQRTSCVRRRNGAVYCVGADAMAERGDGTPNAQHCTQNRSAGSLVMTNIP